MNVSTKIIMTKIGQPISLLHELETSLVLFEPEKHLPQIARNVKDIYMQRFLLRDIPGSDFAVDYLASTVLEALKSKQRLRTYDCLKVIRSIIRNRNTKQLSTKITHKLFNLYQIFVFSEREEIQWCVSVFLKDQLLVSKDIDWLIENYSRSNHIANRLLRYPRPTDAIRRWAEEVRGSALLLERRPEIIGLLLPERFQELRSTEDAASLALGIYYARADDSEKEDMLMQMASIETVKPVMDVAMRLHYSKPIKRLIAIIKSMG